MALSNMRKCTEEWRSFANKRKKDAKKGKKLKSPPKRQSHSARISKSRTGPPRAAQAGTGAGVSTTKTDHNNFREVLPADVIENNCSDKHLALVHEAKKLDIVDSSYCGMALIRMLFECSVVKYLTRNGKYDASPPSFASSSGRSAETSAIQSRFVSAGSTEGSSQVIKNSPRSSDFCITGLPEITVIV
jgi:hypothetical protein